MHSHVSIQYPFIYKHTIILQFLFPTIVEKESDKGDGERHAIMNVLVASNRFGFKVLAQQCERKLSMNLEYAIVNLMIVDRCQINTCCFLVVQELFNSCGSRGFTVCPRIQSH